MKNNNTIAYRCPKCGSMIYAADGVFTLSLDHFKLNCPCKGSSLTFEYLPGDKASVTVPCFICGDNHKFTLSSGALLKKDTMSLICSNTGVEICYFGDRNIIEKHVAESEEEINNLTDNNSGKFFDRDKDGLDINPEIIDTVIFTLSDLKEENKIFCKCDGGCKDYEIQYGDDSIFVVCRECGAEAEISCDSMAAAEKFLNSDELVME